MLGMEAWGRGGAAELALLTGQGACMWAQKAAEEDFAEGAEQQLLGEGHDSMRSDWRCMAVAA